MLSQMNGCHVPGNRSHTEPGLQANWQILSPRLWAGMGDKRENQPSC